MSIPKPPLKPGDFHLVVNATQDDKALEPSPGKLYDHTGKLIKTFPTLAQGINGPSYKVVGGDTVPGLYVVSYVVRTQPDEPASTWAAFGEWFLGLGAAPGHADPQAQYGRAGEGIHAGGSVLGIRYSDRFLPLAKRTQALAARQPLVATHGCVRVWGEIAEYLAQLALALQAKGNLLFVSVHQ